MNYELSGRVFVKNIRLHAFHGVLPQERKTGNDYSVSISVRYPFGEVLTSDNVEHTLNYACIYDIVREEMAVCSNLVEHVAGRIARRVLQEFSLADDVHVEVVKLNPPMGAACDGAGVSLVMCRKDL